MKNKTFLRVEFFFSLKKYLSEIVGGILGFIYVHSDTKRLIIDQLWKIRNVWRSLSVGVQAGTGVFS